MISHIWDFVPDSDSRIRWLAHSLLNLVSECDALEDTCLSAVTMLPSATNKNCDGIEELKEIFVERSCEALGK